MAHERWSECARHLRRHCRGMVALALLVLSACDPTGNLIGSGRGGSDDTDPELVGAWRNQHLVPGGSDKLVNTIASVMGTEARVTAGRPRCALLRAA